MVWWESGSKPSPSILQRSTSLGGGIGSNRSFELAIMVDLECWASSLAGGRWRGIYTPPRKSGRWSHLNRIIRFKIEPDNPDDSDNPMHLEQSGCEKSGYLQYQILLVLSHISTSLRRNRIIRLIWKNPVPKNPVVSNTENF